MKGEFRLAILKKDLQLLNTTNDEFLKILISQAEAAIRREGITLVEDDIESDMVVIQYAAYLFRKRAGTDTAMPRFLRLQLNNMLFSQKAQKGSTP